MAAVQNPTEITGTIHPTKTVRSYLYDQYYKSCWLSSPGAKKSYYPVLLHSFPSLPTEKQLASTMHVPIPWHTRLLKTDGRRKEHPI